MLIWITPKEIAKGIEGLPKIPINTQNVIRSKKMITYSKVGRKIVYKREWIEDYLERNIRKAKDSINDK